MGGEHRRVARAERERSLELDLPLAVEDDDVVVEAANEGVDVGAVVRRELGGGEIDDERHRGTMAHAAASVYTRGVPEGDSLFRLAAKLRPYLVGATLVRVLFPTKALDPERLTGKRVASVEAQGKNLLVQCDDGTTLHVHLRMTGRFRVVPLWDKTGERTASVVLETARARIVGTHVPVVRILSAAELRRDERLRALGPDPLRPGFDAERAVAGLLALGRLTIGEALLDQRALAGLGNVYKSELLFRAKLDPFTRVRDLDAGVLRALVDDGAELLRWNAERQARGARGRITRTPAQVRAAGGGKSPTGQSVYGRTNRPCFDCGQSIRSASQGGRTTYWCPICQPPQT